MLGPCLSPHVADHPLRPATRHCLGKPLPYQQADRSKADLIPPELYSCARLDLRQREAGELWDISPAFAGVFPGKRHVPCHYSPVRHALTSVRLACVKHAASVRPEPGSNSQLSLKRLLSLSNKFKKR